MVLYYHPSFSALSGSCDDFGAVVSILVLGSAVIRYYSSGSSAVFGVVSTVLMSVSLCKCRLSSSLMQPVTGVEVLLYLFEGSRCIF